MTITVEVQEKCADILPELHDINSWVLAEEQQKDITCDSLTSDQVDWILKHSAATSVPVDFISLESSPRTADSDAAVNKLVENGVVIITVQ